MSHNILITGASGYLGGTLLARWTSARLPPYRKLYALVRNDKQSEAVKQYGAEPVNLDISDHAALHETIVHHEITIVYFLIDALDSTHQVPMIKALGQVKAKTGKEVHFLHTTGAKLFSRHAGIPTDRPLLDTDPMLYELLKNAKSPHSIFDRPARANLTVIDTADAFGVKSYVFAPCLVYGQGEGFGNKISIQDVAIVKAALKLGNVYKVDTDNPIWPVCHVVDTIELYLQILRKILSGSEIGWGKNGFFLAASGSIHWNDVYEAMATALAKRGVINSRRIAQADDEVLAKMGEALQVPPAIVQVHLGGKCLFTAEHGRVLGWKPHYPPEHILDAADAEVDLILRNL
ncbi:hypothetical protein ARAM_001734 [Aspergillus rambellii]|uniref:NAD-dependent epimerase/dehydratase domain-containing protein n=1 Tax=Aspergillus rambellii TaxID=308745 RepID=A0A0F8X9D3_9EURO|nr:hypothetical protein ARAM_001734 [Aspergillus rambellii]